MSFVETPRFPDRLAYGAVGGPLFSTDIVVLDSGSETRNQNWSQARAEYTLDFVNRSTTDRDELIHYFRSVAKGRLNGFRFKDWNDYSASISEGVFSQVAGDVWQMAKRYTQGAQTFDRTIAKPISPLTQVKSGGTVLTAGVHYTLDSTTGYVTMLGSPSIVPTAWSGTFDVPVRFDSDYLGLRIFALDNSGAALADAPSIKLVEIRI